MSKRTGYSSERGGRQVKEWLSGLSELMPDFVGAIRLDGRLLYVNAAGRQIVGMSAGTDLGNTMIDSLFAREAGDALRRTALPAAFEHGAWSGESRVRRVDDGREVVLWLVIAVQRDDDGVEAGYTLFGRDLSRQRELEASLSEVKRTLNSTEARFVLAFHRAPNGLSISELETGRYLDVNDSYCQLAGFKREELLGRRSLDVGIWDNPADRDAIVAEAIRSRQIRNVEIRGRNRSGKHLIVIMDADVIELEGRNCLVTSLRDVSETRRMEQAIRESEERYRALVEYSPEGIVVHRNNRVVLINRAALQLVGAKRLEHVLGRSPLDFIHPDSRPIALARIQQVVSGQAVVPNTELRLQRVDGSVCDVQSISAAVTFDGERSVMVLLQDISRRRAAESALRLSEEKFAKAFRASPDAITIMRLSDSVFTDVNQGFLDLTGFSREEVIGRTTIELNLWFDAELREEMSRRLLRDRSVRDFECAFRMKNGRARMCSASAEVADINGGPCMIAIVRDLTAREEAAAALKESEDRYRIVAEQTGQLIYDLDVPSGVIKWAGAIECLTGFTTREFEHVDFAAFAEMIHLDDHEPAIKLYEAAKVSRQPFTARFRFRRRDGNYITVENSGQFLNDADGHVVRMLGTMNDVTERDRLEAELLEAHKMESVGRLAGGVAHEFNNVLTVMLGHLALLARDSRLPADLTASLGEVEHAGELGAGLTRQLLAFSRQQLLQKTSVDLAVVFDGLSKLLARTLGEDVKLDVEVAPETPLALADRAAIEQVLLNLSVNARDAMPHGGRLVLRVGGMRVDALRARRHPQGRAGRFVCIEVVDSGVGIPPEILPRIFDPFFTTKDGGLGSGLGLASVYGLVLQHEGWMEVESSLGVGTTFRIMLPVSTEPPVAPATPGSAAAAGGQGETIFVIEDEAPVRRLIELVLTRTNYRVISAGSGREALELWDQDRPHFDLLLTDVILPDKMTGKDVADRLREAGVRTQVVFISGYRADVLREVVRDRGEYFVEKPFKIDHLLAVIRRALDVARR